MDKTHLDKTPAGHNSHEQNPPGQNSCWTQLSRTKPTWTNLSLDTTPTDTTHLDKSSAGHNSHGQNPPGQISRWTQLTRTKRTWTNLLLDKTPAGHNTVTRKWTKPLLFIFFNVALWSSGLTEIFFFQILDRALCRAFKVQQVFVSVLQVIHLPPYLHQIEGTIGF